MNDTTREMEKFGWSWDTMIQKYKYGPITSITLDYEEAKKIVSGGKIKEYTAEKIRQHTKLMKLRKKGG